MNKYEKEDWLRVIKEMAKMFGYVLAWFGSAILWVMIFLGLCLLFDDPEIAEIIMLSCTVLGVIILLIMRKREIKNQENKTGYNSSKKKSLVNPLSFWPILPSKIEHSRYKIILYPLIFILYVGFIMFFEDIIMDILILFFIISCCLGFNKFKKQDEAAKNDLYKKLDAMEKNYNFISPEQAEREKMKKTPDNSGQFK